VRAPAVPLGGLASQAVRPADPSPFVVQATRDFAVAAPVWSELEPGGSAFQTQEWIKPWFMTLGVPRGAEPLFVMARARATGRPVALFVLCVRRRWGVRIAEFPDFGVSDYNMPICAPDLAVTDAELAALWVGVRDAVPGVDVFWFDKMPEALYGRPVPFARLGWMAPMDLRCWTLELPASRAIYDSQSLKAKDRKEHKRKRRNLVERLGELQLVEAATREQAQAFYRTLKAMRAERFRRQGRRDLLRIRRFARFYETLVLTGWPGFVSLALVKAGDAPVAAMMGLRRGGAFVLIMHSFNAELEQSSPGVVALDVLITYLIEKGFHRCDFTAGNESYKLQFGVTPGGMRQGHDAVTRKGRLYAAAASRWAGLRAGLARHYGGLARRLRRLTTPRWR